LAPIFKADFKIQGILMTPLLTRVARGLSGARWLLNSCEESTLLRLSAETGENRILLQCVLNRGLADVDEIQ
jgi:hypothetical protein